MLGNLMGPILLKAIIDRKKAVITNDAEMIKKCNAIITSQRPAGGTSHPLEVFVDAMHNQGFNIADAPWDGNCFFFTIAQELRNIKPDYDSTTHQSLRQITAAYIRLHHHDFDGFTLDRRGNPITTELYTSQLENDGNPADEIAIRALTNELYININIHHVDGTITQITPDANQTTDTDNPFTSNTPTIDIGFTGGHYVRLTPSITASLTEISDNIITNPSSSESTEHMNTEDTNTHHTNHKHEERTEEYIPLLETHINYPPINYTYHGHHAEDLTPTISIQLQTTSHSDQIIEIRRAAADRYVNHINSILSQDNEETSNTCNLYQTMTTIAGIAIPLLAIYFSFFNNNSDYDL